MMIHATTKKDVKQQHKRKDNNKTNKKYEMAMERKSRATYKQRYL